MNDKRYRDYTQELKIYKDSYDLVKLLLTQHKNIPKLLRYTIYNKIINDMCEVIDGIYRANSNKDERVKELTNIFNKLGGIKTRVRLIGEEKGFTIKLRTKIIFDIENIMQQILWWKNSEKNK